MRNDFLETLSSRPLVLDGAMGTQLYERGIYVNKSFDDANLTRPDLVHSIHEAYVDAGADILTTNTFAANRIKLKRHGLEAQAAEINRAGVEIAQRASGAHICVAGSMGPTGLTPTVLTDGELQEIRVAFRQQAEALIEAGVDLISLETFRQLSEMRLALEAVRQVADIPVVAHMAFDAEHRTGDGATPERVVMLLRDWGADVVGANCMEGPHVIFDVVNEMVGKGVPIAAQPNAGYPRRVDERLVYMATPEYFGVYARRFFKVGVRLMGGCCGTGPEHVKRIAAAARMMGGGRVQVQVAEVADHSSDAEGIESEVSVDERSELAAKIMRVHRERVKAEPSQRPALSREHFVVSVEVNPPSGLDPRKAVEAAQMLKEGGVDVINIADGPRASVRMSNTALGLLLQQDLGTEVILHICGRDRNLLGLQSDILAMHVLGLHNAVVITGDPPKIGDYPHATAVFDLDSIGILRMMQSLNRGVDPSGKSIGDRTRFFCACGAEPAAMDYEREIRRLELKRAAGAQFVMTQPVYDADLLSRFLKDIAHLNMPVLVGLLPLASYRNAEFLHNEVPGMQVPEAIRQRMKSAGSGPVARQQGVQIAQEILMEVRDHVVGAYIMPPFGRYVAALEILEPLQGYASPNVPAAQTGS